MHVDFEPPNGNTVSRRLWLGAPPDEAQLECLAKMLAALGGVKSLEACGQELRIAYDFSRLEFGTLVRETAECGIAVDESGWRRLRGAWYRFTDANARDSTQLKPTCCSRPPPGAGKPE